MLQLLDLTTVREDFATFIQDQRLQLRKIEETNSHEIFYLASTSYQNITSMSGSDDQYL
jgi:hypothetical protein